MKQRHYRRAAALLLAPMLGCATQPQLYTQWREFHGAVDHLDADGRSAHYARLRDLNANASTALLRLQLAYLLSYPDTSGAIASTNTREIRALIDTVDDAHVLAPIRDLLAQSLALQQILGEQRRQFEDLGRECDATDARLQALRLEQTHTQTAVDTCREQLDALKQIESMMSDAGGSLKVAP